jgi:hypothetical protein
VIISSDPKDTNTRGWLSESSSPLE